MSGGAPANGEEGMKAGAGGPQRKSLPEKASKREGREEYGEPPCTPTDSGGGHDADMCSPDAIEKRRWLLTQEQVAEKDTLHVAVPTTPVRHKASRVGDAFQARVPAVGNTRPSKETGKPVPDQRVGERGPSEEEALKMSSVEREFAKGLPRDATADIHMEEQEDSGPPAVRPGLLDRSQRVRRRPQWLDGQNLYGIRRKTRGEDSSVAGEMGEDGDSGAIKDEPPSMGGLSKQPSSLRGIRSKRSKAAASAVSLQELVDDESTLSDEPMLQHWVLAPDRSSVSLTVVLDGVTYSGLLDVARPHVPRGARRGRKPRGRIPAPVVLDDDSSPTVSMDQDAYHQSHTGEEGDEQLRSYPGGKRGRRGSSDEVRPGKKQQLGGQEDKEKPQTFHSERHQKAEERFRQLEEAGAPLDTLCSLCHLEENETVVYDHPEDGVEVRLNLGRLLLVRTSTITHAWVHFECGRWCPEVREVDADEDEVLEGVTLEGLPEAVRRGRRIKCTECGQKGATIGCFARGCRRSFHLQCACVAGCLIKEGTFESYCLEHAELYSGYRRSKRPSESQGGDLESRRGGEDNGPALSDDEAPLRGGSTWADAPVEVEEADDAALAADILGALQRSASDTNLKPSKRPATTNQMFKSRSGGRGSGPKGVTSPEGGPPSGGDAALPRKPGAPAAPPTFRPTAPGAVPPAPVRSKKTARLDGGAGFARQPSPPVPPNVIAAARLQAGIGNANFRPRGQLVSMSTGGFRPGGGLVSKNTFVRTTSPPGSYSNSEEFFSGSADTAGDDSQQGESNEHVGGPACEAAAKTVKTVAKATPAPGGSGNGPTPEKKPPAWLARAMAAAAAAAEQNA